jgi:AcrR family transcriptional regulator
MTAGTHSTGAAGTASDGPAGTASDEAASVPAAPAPGRERVLRDVVDYFAAHGTGEASLRRIAAEVGTSHRMLNYYFGPREGLLTAVVETLEADQRSLLDAMVAQDLADPTDELRRFWAQVSDAALVYGPLFFELSAGAMHGLPHAAALRSSLIRPWLDLLEQRLRQWGYDAEPAAAQARIGLAVARGLLFDLLITGDRQGVDAAMDAFIAASIPPAPPDGI